VNLRRVVPAALLAASAIASAQQLPNGFHRTDPITDRDLPTGVYFAHNGEVFVTEKNGRVWRYTNLLDTTPVLFADISAEIHTIGDRGLLGFALDPRYPDVPRVYMLYAFNGGLFDDLPPRWGNDCGSTVQETPDPGTPGGCVVSGHLSRFDVLDGVVVPASETVLIEDWYQFFPSHSIGTLLFGEDGYLYAGGGDGASYNWADWGQGVGNPDFPDERSPTIGGVPEGGALRSQGLEVESDYADQQVWLDGAILRINPATGEGAPDNPLATSGLSENARRIVAYGLRNPFRFTERRGTGEIWVGDVGWNTWEEVNRIPALPTDGSAALVNFGWPCFEGRVHTQGYNSSNLPICQALYANGDTGGRTPWTAPWYTYAHTASSDITGLAFYTGTSYPEAYRNSLFTADNSRSVIFNFPFVDANGDGVPDAPPDSSADAFYGGFEAPAVQLTGGPGADIFYPNINLGRISRISYCDGCTNVAPSAAIEVFNGSVADGPPRWIAFRASNSIDPDHGDTLTYDWDLDGDGVFGDAEFDTTAHFYADEGSYRVSVRVTDSAGASDTQSMIVTVIGNLGTTDLGIAIDDGSVSVFAGSFVTYTVTVTNHSTIDVIGEHVATALSPMLTGVGWFCDPGTGGSCESEGGTGDIDSNPTVLAGGVIRYLVGGFLAADASGTLESAAMLTVAPGYIDPDSSNDTASDSDAIVDDRLFADGFEG
jgi:glucose/arabinose dehydrogenase